jgi:hypothetical protein
MRTMATLWVDERYGLWRTQASFPSLIPDVDFITFNNEDDLQKLLPNCRII